MFDAIIIGAGFAGAVMAERLASEQGRQVLVVERRSHIGGNCHDMRDENGILIHTYGPHLFHTDDADVYLQRKGSHFAAEAVGKQGSAVSGGFCL